MATAGELLDRLESRHDELIRKLDDLNAAIESTLAQFAKARSDSAPAREAAVDVASVGREAFRPAA